ncbi:hypothetical protein CVT24_002712 [Panaeolus cyanescens]|uniref:Uncharacterized protein n=1 Tax=Panaeolus cyanescens TaxID=181874 RepID=A0A409YY67_9AGAR|nr:hypothetical protein CVT24_002712 [Panaeolus cyanescens]
MTTRTLIVEIDDTQLVSLPYGINLCIAMQVNCISNVVWASRKLEHLSKKNPFQWTDEYQIFGAHADFISNNPLNIRFGQMTTYSADGYISSPVDDPDVVGNTIRVHNDFDDAYIGISAKLEGEYLPVFVSPTPLVLQADTDFKPVDNVIVFWSSTDTTSTMTSHITGPSIEVDLTAQATQTVSFTGPPNQGKFFPGPLPPPAA